MVPAIFRLPRYGIGLATKEGTDIYYDTREYSNDKRPSTRKLEAQVQAYVWTQVHTAVHVERSVSLEHLTLLGAVVYTRRCTTTFHSVETESVRHEEKR